MPILNKIKYGVIATLSYSGLCFGTLVSDFYSYVRYIDEPEKIPPRFKVIDMFVVPILGTRWNPGFPQRDPFWTKPLNINIDAEKKKITWKTKRNTLHIFKKE